jgi:hypothetical protein
MKTRGCSIFGRDSPRSSNSRYWRTLSALTELSRSIFNIARVGPDVRIPELVPESKTYAEQSANVRFSFGMLLCARPSLVPMDGGHQYQDMGGAFQIVRGDKSCQHSQAFRQMGGFAFLRRKMFKIKDLNEQHNFGIHRWLELAQKRQYLESIRALELDLNLGARG